MAARISSTPSEIANASKQLKVKVLDKIARTAREAVRITLAQSLPKTDKMDLIVQKATELGAHKIVPFVSSRSIPVLTPDKARQRRERWQKIALEAARQCRRPDVPEVAEVVTFRRNAGSRGGSGPEDHPLGRGDRDENKKRPGPAQADAFMVIAIGPEGGFSPEEVEAGPRPRFHPQ